MALEDPGWWPARGSARGEGVRVGEMGGGSGPGDGVLLFKIFNNFSLNIFPLRAHLASGDRGMWPTDFRLEGEWRFLVLMCSLCLSPCRELGRGEDTAPEEEPEYCHLLLIKTLSGKIFERKNILFK